ncbi:AtuA-related protein [Clostridium folliculivorans]|uniref:AtuA-like ferredoxin-fold domain-containing protein n=1 Tax=Clostridium folliculivorans TaxID=2886038 RepID=A0A9W6D9I6_9CLOT|nr:hypothetical protein [Clostridium folliculivorans]GKU24360.1 hypothetical protein CFOLD11_11860 [Clostridium folliculivorans]GKU30455.1 hypothetical protein CFB3_25620 [Clostridium folliculivorans]
MVKLKDIAHGRSGDKGDVSNICIYAREPKYYEIIKAQVTPEAVKKHFKGMVQGEIERYEVPQLDGFNFVLHHALDGGATRSLRLDALGKSMEAALLRMDIELSK